MITRRRARGSRTSTIRPNQRLAVVSLLPRRLGVLPSQIGLLLPQRTADRLCNLPLRIRRGYSRPTGDARAVLHKLRGITTQLSVPGQNIRRFRIIQLRIWIPASVSIRRRLQTLWISSSRPHSALAVNCSRARHSRTRRHTLLTRTLRLRQLRRLRHANRRLSRRALPLRLLEVLQLLPLLLRQRIHATLCMRLSLGLLLGSRRWLPRHRRLRRILPIRLLEVLRLMLLLLTELTRIQ
ncbi:hypothetical protein ABIE67_009399 [Streptomyces sp. V4I8]